MILTLYFIISKETITMHLDIRNTIVSTNSGKKQHGTVTKIPYYHFYRRHNNTENLSSTINYYHTERESQKTEYR